MNTDEHSLHGLDRNHVILSTFTVLSIQLISPNQETDGIARHVSSVRGKLVVVILRRLRRPRAFFCWIYLYTIYSRIFARVLIGKLNCFIIMYYLSARHHNGC